MDLQLNDVAPDFSLFNSDKQLIHLNSFKGHNLIIIFFPAAFSETCTKELCSLRDNISFYKLFNTKIIAISTDSIYCLSQFKKENNLNFTLISDYNKEVSELYGVQYKEFGYRMKGVSKRAVFVLDSDLKIKYIEIMDSAIDLPNFIKINEILFKH